MFKNNMKFTKEACRINLKISSSDNKPHSWYFHVVTIVAHFFVVIIEGLIFCGKLLPEVN